MLKDKLFWFSQPPLNLTTYDKYFMWFFAGLVIIGILLKLMNRFLISHPVKSKLWNKFGNAGVTMGLIGLFWYVLRYENTPFLANRYWAGIITLLLLIWIWYIVKYLFWQYSSERNSFDRMQLNSKYIPGPRR